MFRYVIKRLIFIIIFISILCVVLYVLLTYTNLVHWTRGISKAEIFKDSIDEFKTFFEGVLTSWHWGYNDKGESIWVMFKEGLPMSIKLNMIAFTLYISLGCIVGFVAAYYKDKWIDNLIMSVVMVFSSLPPFIWAMILIVFFGYYTRLLPPTYNLNQGYFLPQISRYFIPVIALSVFPLAKIARVVRSELIESYGSDHSILCRAKGLTRYQIFLRHSLKDTMVVLMPQIPNIFIFTLINSFIVENAYSYPGIAKMFLDALVGFDGDYSYVMIDNQIITLTTLFVVLFVMLTSLITDMAIMIIDPRIRYLKVK